MIQLTTDGLVASPTGVTTAAAAAHHHPGPPAAAAAERRQHAPEPAGAEPSSLDPSQAPAPSPSAGGEPAAPAAGAGGGGGAPAAATAGGGLTPLERETALQALNLLCKSRDADPFRQPVDWEALDIPDYPEVVARPMDLHTVRSKVRSGAYASLDEWRADVQLIWDNCRQYNGEHHPFTAAACKLAAALERRMDEAEAAARRELAAREGGGGAAAGGGGGAAAGGGGGGKVKLGRLAAATASDGDSQGNEAALRPLVVDQLRQPLKRAASGGQLSPRGGAKRRPGTSGLGGRTAAGADGVDLDAMERLCSSPAAQQLGVGDADDLAFLAVWKRVVASKQQARSEADALRHSLAAAEAAQRQLQTRLDAEAAARRQAEQRLAEVQRQHTQLQEQQQQQQQVLEHQRQVLEQQQQVIRQVLKQQQEQQQLLQQHQLQQQRQDAEQAPAEAPAGEQLEPQEPQQLAPVLPVEPGEADAMAPMQ